MSKTNPIIKIPFLVSWLPVKKIAGFVHSIVLLFAATRWIKMERDKCFGV
jgi:hypothetical protein